MHLLDSLLKLDEDQLGYIQNAFLEAKTISFRNFFVGGAYACSKSLSDNIRQELEKKDPKIETLVKLLECDPLNLMRMISLAYSPAYVRTNLNPTTTSLIQQFGYKRLPALFEEVAGPGPASLASFYAQRAMGLEQFQRVILSACLARKIAALFKAPENVKEETFLLSVGMNLPRLLLGCYNADLLSAWFLDSGKNNLSYQKACEKFFMESEENIAGDILRKMSLPLKFLESVSNLGVPPWNKRTWSKEQQERMQVPCTSAYVANEIIDELLLYGYESNFYTLVTDLSEKCSFDYKLAMEAISELPLELKVNEKKLGIEFPDLPGFSLRLAKKNEQVGKEGSELIRSDKAKLFRSYMAEIKTSVKSFRERQQSRDLYHALYLGMSLLLRVLKFDRAIVFSYEPMNNVLSTYFAFGRGVDIAKDCKVKVEVGKNRVSPVVQSYFEGKAVFTGDPIFEDDWPFITFPISFKGEIYGVFYADVASKNKATRLSTEEQMSVISLAELFIIV